MSENTMSRPSVGQTVRIKYAGSDLDGEIGTLVERDGNRYVVEVEGVRHAFYGHGVVRAAVAH